MNTKSPSRWLRFSLRTMFIVVTLLCCWLGWESSIVRKRQAVLQEIRAKWDVVVFKADEWVPHSRPDMPAPPRASVPLVRGWLGDEAIQQILYIQPLSEPERQRLARVFPEAKLLEIMPEPCHPGCFPSGTLVDTPQGPRIIESTQPGDLVTAISSGGEALTATVQSVFVTDNLLWNIRTEAGILFTTQTQPLCLAAGDIQAAGKLQPGDVILHRQQGEIRSVKVLEVASTGRTEKVFNVVLGDSEIFVAGGYLARSKPPPEIAAK